MTAQLALLDDAPPEPIPWDTLLELAACAGTYSPAFTQTPRRGGRGGDDPAQWHPARIICHACPVREGCLAEALIHPDRYKWSMMGGLTPRERRQLLTRFRLGIG